MKKNKPEDIQLKYYSNTALLYDKTHVIGDDEHFMALKNISLFLKQLDVSSILDVGCGTGRGVKFFCDNYPKIKVMGVEPVKELIDQAIDKNKILPNLIISGKGESLPFEDNSFDICCSFGIMHHTKRPNLIVKEMMRVAKKAVFISDSNRFGQGCMAMRWLKLFFYKIGLWNLINLIKTKGKGYMISEGDGLFYSYSIFDSYDILAKWSDKIIFIPTSNKINVKISWLHPLLTSPHVLLCAIKD